MAVFTTRLISASDEFNVYITIYGEHGDTGQRHLHESVTYSDPFAANQIDVFFVEAVHLGRLQHVLLEFSSCGRGPIYCYSFHCGRFSVLNYLSRCFRLFDYG